MSQPTSFTATDQPPPLDHRTVRVTGGSRGIGVATVRALHRDGATVVFNRIRARQTPVAPAVSLGALRITSLRWDEGWILDDQFLLQRSTSQESETRGLGDGGCP
jgi:NAD(P)-dependent dehydrogenase (short-subunit alcohol dehydrogenase family)